MFLRNYKFDFFHQGLNRTLYTWRGLFMFWFLHENLDSPKIPKNGISFDFSQYSNLLCPSLMACCLYKLSEKKRLFLFSCWQLRLDTFDASVFTYPRKSVLSCFAWSSFSLICFLLKVLRKRHHSMRSFTTLREHPSQNLTRLAVLSCCSCSNGRVQNFGYSRVQPIPFRSV